MGTSHERCCLGKESSIDQRRCEIRVRLSFDDDPTVSFGNVDAKPPMPCHVRGANTALGSSIVGGDVHHLEGKTKGPQSGETINESCKLPRRLGASA